MKRSPGIVPCEPDVEWGGRLMQDYCGECGHSLAVHRNDHTCTVCDVFAELEARIIALEAKHAP